MRPIDRIAIVGVMLVAFGAAISMVAESSLPLWIRWLAASLLWYGGFAFMLAWAVLRMFPAKRMRKAEREEGARAKAPAPKITLVWSNFLEHDHDSVA